MKTRRLGAIGESEARTQCLVRSSATGEAEDAAQEPTQRASERGQVVECFVLLELPSVR